MQLQLISILSNTLGISIEQININSSSENIKQWDSLKHMNVIFAVEDEFNIIVPDEQLANSTSVKSLLQIINDTK